MVICLERNTPWDVCLALMGSRPPQLPVDRGSTAARPGRGPKAGASRRRRGALVPKGDAWAPKTAFRTCGRCLHPQKEAFKSGDFSFSQEIQKNRDSFTLKRGCNVTRLDVNMAVQDNMHLLQGSSMGPSSFSLFSSSSPSSLPRSLQSLQAQFAPAPAPPACGSTHHTGDPRWTHPKRS